MLKVIRTRIKVWLLNSSQNDLFFMPGENSSNMNETTYMNLNTHTGYESDNAGGKGFAQSTPGDTQINKTIPMVCHNKVHRGRVSRDLIFFFYLGTMIRQCLKTICEKMGHQRLSDARCMPRWIFECHFFLQFTEGNAWSPDTCTNEAAAR